MTSNNTEPTDERLIANCLAGNDEAFVQLVGRYKRRVFSLAARFARDADDLEDICQEVFIKVYENLGKLRPDSQFDHWLSRVTVRTCYDALRKRKRELHHLPWEDVQNEIEANSTNASETAEQARTLLEWGLVQLKPEERLVITLLEIEEKSVKEIAALTDWSEANVKVRAFRARQKLKHLLESHHEK